MNLTLARGVGVGALAGLLFGFDTAVVAGTTHGLTAAFHLDPVGLGVTVSSALWGTLAGALFAGRPGDRFGALVCLRVIAVLYLASGVGSALAFNWPSLLLFRVLAGLAIGASSVLAPVYLAEIAPPDRRGALVGAFQLNIVIGILVAYLSNDLIGQAHLGDMDWRWKFAAAVLPAGLLFALLFTLPQSPRWLAMRGRGDDARTVLARLGAADPAAALARILEAADASAGGGKSGLSWRRHRRPLLLAVAIAGFNQLSGINAILYYLNDIFTAAGFSSVSADQQAVIIGATNFAFTALALTIIDRVGRRTLLLVGSVGLILALSGTAAILLTGRGQALLLWMLIGFIAAFAVSQGAVIWVYISEIFPNEVRAQGQSVGSSTHWFMDAIIATGFPVVASVSRGGPFVIFALMMVAQLVVVWRFFPETQRTALEDISSRLG